MADIYELKDFAFATVLDVEVYPDKTQFFEATDTGKVYAVPGTYNGLAQGALLDAALQTADINAIAKLDSLTMSNITQEGPTKETRGGIYAEPIIRHKKTVRLEMEDVVMTPAALQALFGANLYKDTIIVTPAGVDNDPPAVTKEVITGFGMTDTFATMLTLRGKTYVVERATGARRWIDIVFKRFLPDSIVDMMMEAEGDLGVVNVAGELFPDACGEYFTVGRVTNADCGEEDENPYTAA
jgi:hypothetical protein